MKKIIILPLLIIIIVTIISITYLKFAYPIKHTTIIDKYASKYNLNKSLIYSTINVESGFNQNAISTANACGLMQILPTTANEIANKLKIEDYNILDIETNIHFGCYYLRYLLNIYNEDLTKTIMAYNAGLGTVNNWIANNISQENIPFKETKNYVKKINFNIKIYNLKLNHKIK